MSSLRTAFVVALFARGTTGQGAGLRGASRRAESFDRNGTIRATEDIYVLGYAQHKHLNCYTDHGATPLGPDDGLQAGVSNAEDCGRACDQNGCSCFVFFWKHNQCFLRNECDLAACEQGVQGEESYEFDTFTPGPAGAECFCEHGRGKWIPYSPPGTLACECYECDHGYMTTDMQCVPVYFSEYEHVNCYSGHGGDSVWPNDGLQANVHDVQSCQDTCNSESACNCFVFFSKYNQCFLRSYCALQQCDEGVPGEESYLFDTYISPANPQPTAAYHISAENATTELSSDEYVNVLGYQQHTHLNCYTDHGATPLGPDDGLQAGVSNAEDCGRSCDKNGCSCFVFFWKNNQCFLREECDLEACEQGVQGTESYEFDTFTRGSEGAECFCEHGRGKWISYSPPVDLACECYECDPGYMTTDMACVPVQYNHHEHLNCYTGHGGTSIGPNDGLQADVHDAQGCENACNYENGCSCFVFFSKTSQCFLRSACKLQECEQGVSGEENYLFDTYIAW